MEWAVWFFTVDLWLLGQLAYGNLEAWYSALLAMGGAAANTLAGALGFVLLLWLGSKLSKRLNSSRLSHLIERRVNSATNRKRLRGEEVGFVLRGREHYRYAVIWLLNLFPLTPFVSAATVFYSVHIKDPKALLSVIFGACTKVVIIIAWHLVNN